MIKQIIILRKRAAPKVINLPNGRTFTAKWERISRKQLTINTKVSKQRTIGPRKNSRIIYLNQAAPALKRKQEITNRLSPIYNRVNQRGEGLGSSLAKAGLELESKAFASGFGKKISKQRY